MKTTTGFFTVKPFIDLCDVKLRYKANPRILLCSTNQLNGFSGNLGKTFGLQQELSKKEMEHEEKFEGTCEDLKG